MLLCFHIVICLTSLILPQESLASSRLSVPLAGPWGDDAVGPVWIKGPTLLSSAWLAGPVLGAGVAAVAGRGAAPERLCLPGPPSDGRQAGGCAVGGAASQETGDGTELGKPGLLRGTRSQETKPS